jgi:hypothetical protein
VSETKSTCQIGTSAHDVTVTYPKQLLITAILLTGFACANAQNIPTDSTLDRRLVKIKLTARVHSMGLFTYGGRIASGYPAGDLNFTCEVKNTGLSLFKSVNFGDHLAGNNFMLVLLYQNIRLGRVITITPNIGFRVDQQRSFIDQTSDAMAILTTAVRLSKNMIADYSMVFSNLIARYDTRDWVNRFRLLYSKKHIDITYLVWHNNHVLDHSQYVSSGATFAYSRIHVTNQMQLGFSATGIAMLETSDPENFPKRDGIIFTITSTFP